MNLNSIITLLLILSVLKNISLAYNGHLYAVSADYEHNGYLLMMNNTSDVFSNVLELGANIQFIQGPRAAKSVGGNHYITTYRQCDFPTCVSHLLTIDVTAGQPSKILSDLTLDAPSNWTIGPLADDDNQAIGIMFPDENDLSNRLVKINKNNGTVSIVKFYSDVDLSFWMPFVREHRIYYAAQYDLSIIGINVDTGNIAANKTMPSSDKYDHLGLFYDSIKDRFLSLVYPRDPTGDVWILAEMNLNTNTSDFDFHLIGATSIPLDYYYWSDMYLAENERQIISVWHDYTTSADRLISINVDNGTVIVNKTIDLNYMTPSGLIHFD